MSDSESGSSLDSDIEGVSSSDLDDLGEEDDDDDDDQSKDSEESDSEKERQKKKKAKVRSVSFLNVSYIALTLTPD